MPFFWQPSSGLNRQAFIQAIVGVKREPRGHYTLSTVCDAAAASLRRFVKILRGKVEHFLERVYR